jgi:hypothetical protein
MSIVTRKRLRQQVASTAVGWTGREGVGIRGLASVDSLPVL